MVPAGRSARVIRSTGLPGDRPSARLAQSHCLLDDGVEVVVVAVVPTAITLPPVACVRFTDRAVISGTSNSSATGARRTLRRRRRRAA